MILSVSSFEERPVVLPSDPSVDVDGSRIDEYERDGYPFAYSEYLEFKPDMEPVVWFLSPLSREAKINFVNASVAGARQGEALMECFRSGCRKWHGLYIDRGNGVEEVKPDVVRRGKGYILSDDCFGQLVDLGLASMMVELGLILVRGSELSRQVKN